MKYIFKKKLYKFLMPILDGLGGVLFWFSKSKNRDISDAPESVLIVRLDHIGDVLLSTAVPKAIKENFPRSRVIFLTASWSAPLLQGNPFVDEVIQFDPPWFSKMRYERNPKAYRFWGLLKVLRQRKIDLAIGLRGDLRENWLMFLAGIKERVGYGITGGSFLLTKEVVYAYGAHESEHQKDLLRAIGIKASSMEPAIYLSANENINFEKRLERMELPPGQKFICFLLGAGAPSKEWPVENTEKFLEDFNRRYKQYKVVLVGSSQRILNRLKVKNASYILNLVGETSLRELCLLAKRSAFFIGPDSGPTHIAAALNAPTLFLYSGTNVYDQWKSLAETASALRHEVSCSPCGLDSCPVSGHPCMSQILPETVLKALENKL